MRDLNVLHWLTVLCIAMVAIAMVVGLIFFPPSVNAQGNEPMECIAAGQAGSQVIYRCEDWDTGVMCYVNTIGMMFCVE